MTILRRIATGLIVGYLCLTAIVFVFQRKLQYFPHQNLGSPQSYGLDMFKEIKLQTEDGLQLTSWYAAAKEGYPTIVHYHGNGGHIAYRVNPILPLLQAGFGALLVEYRGYGGNPGSPSEQGLYSDARAALAYLNEAGIKNDHVVIFGESLGTGVAVKMAQETKVRAVILESPFTSAVDIGQSAYFFLPVRILMWDRFESIDRIADIAAPLLVLHGDRDRIVPYRFGEELFAAAVEPKVMHKIKGAGHGNLIRFGSTKLTLKFLASLGGN